MAGLTALSRITGFVRTWVMGVAFGVSALSNSYQIAQNLPSQLYELVMGGMLITAFLPVYMDVRRKQGVKGAEEYVGNLLGILLLFLGLLALVASVFAPAFIFTQSFLNGDAEGIDTAVYFFRFFSFQILFYGLSSVFSGVLNAHRDYFWSNLGPILNNVVVIAGFVLYPVLVDVNVDLALFIVAVSGTLGVFLQMACQIPAFRKHGIRPRLHVNLRDPALRQTLSLGVPTLIATLCAFVTSSVSSSVALTVNPEAGTSIIQYSRLWYTLPYALIAVSLNTALYTELARDAASENYDAVRAGVSKGISQALFLLIPFALYLIVFAQPLNMIYRAGEFSTEDVLLVSDYLRFLAPALPLYAVFTLLQKCCSALMDMKPYAVSCIAGAIAQIGFSFVGVFLFGWGMRALALSTFVNYAVANLGALIFLRAKLHGLRLRGVARGTLVGAVLGIIGALVGGGLFALLSHLTGAGNTSVVKTLVLLAVSGVVALVVTFAPAVAAKLPEADVIRSLVARVAPQRDA